MKVRTGLTPTLVGAARRRHRLLPSSWSPARADSMGDGARWAWLTAPTSLLQGHSEAGFEDRAPWHQGHRTAQSRWLGWHLRAPVALSRQLDGRPSDIGVADCVDVSLAGPLRCVLCRRAPHGTKVTIRHRRGSFSCCRCCFGPPLLVSGVTAEGRNTSLTLLACPHISPASTCAFACELTSPCSSWRSSGANTAD
jgi:hypothetical protein